MLVKVVVIGLAVLIVSGCVGPRVSSLDYTEGASLEPNEVSDMKLNSVNVTIREEMQVSTDPAIRYPPKETLVWWGEPSGDRKQQVQALVSDAIADATQPLFLGDRLVGIEVTLNQFHAMTPLARMTEIQLGVHEVQFDIALIDTQTGDTLASEVNLNADLRAFSGSTVAPAEAEGQTQAVRIKARIGQVASAWLVN